MSVVNAAVVEIDLNVRVRDNQTVSGFEHCHGLVRVGQAVTAWEPEDNIVTDAIVTDVDHERRLVYLMVNWLGLRDASCPTPTTPA